MPILALTPPRPTIDLSQGFALSLPAAEPDQANPYLCPCCSYGLLRHVRSGKLYWHCHHCYQPMPVWP